MKPLLLVVLLILSGLGSAGAQPALGNRPAAARADSIALLHQVFAKGRQSSRYGTFSFASLLALNASHLPGSEQHSSPMGLAFSTLGASAATAGLTLSIIDWVRFSRHHEALVAAQLEQGQPLPHYVRHLYAKLAARQWQAGHP